ncbi:hypothetical protein MasN3_22400 [Massilia varians]|uniref:GAF domain-containing protein n=1 Tax=Massilia varians TaxID=457921 RepID=A0ABM8C687_9BURK|nr:hypothetical protein MasN3_22400 [Massilia varians]
MPAAPLPPDELDRLSMLDALHLLDTPPEPVFDRVTRLASRMLDVPMALFSLVDADRQWFKSRVGLEPEQTPREHAFCAHAIGMSAPLVVHDALEDGRFSDNPLVNGPPNIRFYAGVPIRTTAGLAIGTLCALDTRPRTLSEDEAAVLNDLAAILTKEVQYRERMAVAREQLARSNAVLGASEARFRTIFDIASVGIALVAPDGGWISVNRPCATSSATARKSCGAAASARSPTRRTSISAWSRCAPSSAASSTGSGSRSATSARTAGRCGSSSTSRPSAMPPARSNTRWR